jgi:exonuclease VII small subunit
MAAREAVGKIPLASSAIEYFSKGMAVKKSLESSLKRARVEAKGALSRSRKKVY